MSYICIDIGTSSVKAAVVNTDGATEARSEASYDLYFPQKDHVELDAEEIYGAVKHVLRELAGASRNVTHLAVSGFGEAFVLTDASLKPLHRMITYADARCVGMDDEIIRQYGGEEIFSLTGVYPNATYSLLRLLWLKRNKPELLSRAKYLFFSVDYFTCLLCGERGLDPGSASKSMLYDVNRGTWSELMLDRFDIPGEWFSPVLRAGTVLGKLRLSVAEELGLSKNIDVCLGGHDQGCATLGAGAVKPGSAVLGEGSTESLNVVADKNWSEYSKILIDRKLCVEPYLRTDSFFVPSAFLTYGNSLRWFIRELGDRADIKRSGEESVFDYLERSSSERTELIFLPHLGKTSITEPEVALPGALVGLTLDTRYPEIYRSLIQGLNFETRIIVELMDKAGFVINDLTAAGGVTKNSLFMQNKSDILKKSIRILKDYDAGINGLAMICSLADGICSSFEEASDRFVSYGRLFEPQEDYEELFESYLHIRNSLKERRW